MAEDNLPDALLVQEAIRAENLPVEVHVVPDGERLLDFMFAPADTAAAPNLHALLLDLNLPKIDGLEVLRRVRAGGRYQKIPVLIISSSDAPADRREAAKLDAGYFRKPTSYEQFLKVGGLVRQLLEQNGLL